MCLPFCVGIRVVDWDVHWHVHVVSNVCTTDVEKSLYASSETL